MCFSWVRCLLLHTARCSQWCSRKLPTQLAHQGTAWDYYHYIWTLCSHLLCDCVYVCVCMSVWTWVGGHKCELADTLCVGGWITSITTTKSVQSVRDLVLSAKEQTSLSAVFWPKTHSAHVSVCVCVYVRKTVRLHLKEAKWNPAAHSCSLT